jgi:hypothetical protein
MRLGKMRTFDGGSCKRELNARLAEQACNTDYNSNNESGHATKQDNITEQHPHGLRSSVLPHHVGLSWFRVMLDTSPCSGRTAYQELAHEPTR